MEESEATPAGQITNRSTAEGRARGKRAYRSSEHSGGSAVRAGIRACFGGSRGSRRKSSIAPPATAGTGIDYLRRGIPNC